LSSQSLSIKVVKNEAGLRILTASRKTALACSKEGKDATTAAPRNNNNGCGAWTRDGASSHLAGTEPYMSDTDATGTPDVFTCNLCGQNNLLSTLRQCAPNSLREAKTCAGCGSSVRTRSIISLLSHELFGVSLELRDFPTLKGVCGLGLSDSEDYAGQLAGKFNYLNTHLDHQPKLDITNVSSWDGRNYDFIIASEVFEHVSPPAFQAFANAAALLADSGFLLLSVPFSLEATTCEHFPELHDYSVVTLRDSSLLVDRSARGSIQVFDNLQFHAGHGATLEMRFFSESSLRSTLLQAGFSEIEIGEPRFIPFGILSPGNWSLPMIARKRSQPPRHSWINELVSQLSHARRLCRLREHNIASLSAEVSRLRSEVERLGAESQERFDWGSASQAQLDTSHARAQELDSELKQRLSWVRGLEEQLSGQHEQAQQRHEQVLQLERELTARTTWAQSLDSEIERLGQKVSAADKEVSHLKQQLTETNQAIWTRIGRKLRLLP